MRVRGSGREGGREGGRERGREGAREGAREGGRERGSERASEGEGGSEVGSEGGREGGRGRERVSGGWGRSAQRAARRTCTISSSDDGFSTSPKPDFSSNFSFLPTLLHFSSQILTASGILAVTAKRLKLLQRFFSTHFAMSMVLLLI